MKTEAEIKTDQLNAFDEENGGVESRVEFDGYYYFKNGAYRTVNGLVCAGPEQNDERAERRGMEVYLNSAKLGAEQAFRELKDSYADMLLLDPDECAEAIAELKKLKRAFHKAEKAELDWLYEYLIPRWGGSCGSEAYANMKSHEESFKIQQEGIADQRKQKARSLAEKLDAIEI